MTKRITSGNQAERDRPVIEVTEEMLDAGFSAVAENGPYGAVWDGQWLADAYRAMRAIAERG